MSILHNLIASGKTKESLNVLLTASKGHDPDVYDEAILLSARFEKYLKNKRLGLIDSDVELRNIEYSILQLSGKVNGQVSHQNTSSPKQHTKLIIGGLILIVIIVVLYVFQYPKNDQRQEVVPQTSTENKTHIDSPIFYPTLKPNKNNNPKVKPPERPIARIRDSIANNATEKPGKIQEDHKPDKTNSSTNQLPQPIESIAEEIEYIKFKLVINASIKRYSIFVDGKPADFLDDSSR